MKAFRSFDRVLGMGLVLLGAAVAGPRDAEWGKVAEAREKDQPKTVMELLSAIEKAAFADGSWAEGTRALVSRIAVEAEIDARLQKSLADAEAFRKVPVADFAELLKAGQLGDELRPTMYDFVANLALEFYASEEVAVSRPVDDFPIAADSPVFGTAEEFLAWKPEVKDAASPKARALAIHRALMEFHRADADPVPQMPKGEPVKVWDAELVDAGDFQMRVAGVEVSAWFTRRVVPGTIQRKAKTDGSGRFEIADQGDGRNYLLVANRGLERAVSRGWTGGRGRAGIEDRTSVVMSTDRAIYRPGQTVHFKGIWCRTNQDKGKYETIESKNTTVVFRDPNRKEVGKVVLESNERGSFSGTFTAPEGAVLGMCRLEVEDGGRAMIRVEESKRPKFFGEVDAPKEPAALGKEVTVKVRGESYTGAPVDDAKVA